MYLKVLVRAMDKIIKIKRGEGLKEENSKSRRSKSSIKINRTVVLMAI